MTSQWRNCVRPLLINDGNYCRVSWLTWLAVLVKAAVHYRKTGCVMAFAMTFLPPEKNTSEPESWLIYMPCLWIYMLSFLHFRPLRRMRVNDTENLDLLPNGHFLSLNLVEIKQTSLPGNEPWAGLQATVPCSWIPSHIPRGSNGNCAGGSKGNILPGNLPER